jgi:large-conductance mechanosensitive channel
MKIVKQFCSFWYHFIVGDDWRIAVGVVIGLTVTTILTRDTILQIWWLMPILVVLMLSLSLWIATREQKK